MLQDGIYAFYIKQQRKFQAEIKQYAIAPNEESIRQMRICVKKMRVIFKLLQRLTDNEINAGRQLRDFRLTFKSIGNIRDLQLQRHLLTDYKTEFNYEFAEYLEYLTVEIYKKSNIFQFNKIDIEDAQLIENQVFVKHFFLIELQEKEILKRIYTFLKNRFAKIEKLLKKGTEEGLHQIRIWYKEIYYLLWLVNKYHFKSDTFQSKLKEIKKFGRQIGTWHDLTIFRDGFQDYINKYPTLHYKIDYQILQSQVNLDVESKMQELQAQLIGAILPQLNKLMYFLK